MIKGTLSTKDFYGQVESIEKTTDVKMGTILINKESGKQFNVLSVIVLKQWLGGSQIISYRIRGTDNLYERVIKFDTIKLLYWKVVK